MVLFVKELPAAVLAKSKIDISLRNFPRDYWQYLLVTALFGIGNSSNSFLILRTTDIGASLEATILIYAAFNLVAAIVSYPAGSLSDLWGRKAVLLLSFVIFLVAYLGFALIQNVVVIAVLFIFYGSYQGIFRAVGKAFATDFVPEHLRASGVGWYNTTVGVTGLVASIVAGLLWDHINHSAVFLYGALFAAAGCIALLILFPTKRGVRCAQYVGRLVTAGGRRGAPNGGGRRRGVRAGQRPSLGHRRAFKSRSAILAPQVAPRLIFSHRNPYRAGVYRPRPSVLLSADAGLACPTICR